MFAGLSRPGIAGQYQSPCCRHIVQLQQSAIVLMCIELMPVQHRNRAKIPEAIVDSIKVLRDKIRVLDAHLVLNSISP